MKTFIDKKDKNKYLHLCEDLFALAEDFNREEYTEEALLIKEVFRQVTQDLSPENEQELNDMLDSRGL